MRRGCVRTSGFVAMGLLQERSESTPPHCVCLVRQVVRGALHAHCDSLCCARSLNADVGLEMQDKADDDELACLGAADARQAFG